MKYDYCALGIKFAAFRVLSENPEYKRIWPQFRSIPDSSLMSSSDLRAFAATYMKGLKSIIETMDDEAKLGETIRRIAAKHVTHNVTMHHVQVSIQNSIAVQESSVIVGKLQAFVNYFKTV